MRLGAIPSSLPASDDLATALEVAAARLGHRPAITVLRDGRERAEQGFVSLRQWASKGAHWLTLEALLEPGDEVGLVGPAGWMPAAFCAAAWWAGLAVRLGPSAATLTLVHESAGDVEAGPDNRPFRPEGETLWFGDAVDASPVGEHAGEVYAVAVQTFPDDPPAPHASPDGVALTGTGAVATSSQRDLLAEARERWQPGGTLGVELHTVDARTALLAVAVRPLATGQATVLLDGVLRESATDERIAVWAEAS